jgi:hypothetical protein
MEALEDEPSWAGGEQKAVSRRRCVSAAESYVQV